MSRRFWFVSVSVVAHLSLGLGIFASGIWAIDRLEPDRRPQTTLAALEPPPPPAGGGGMKLPEVKPDVKPRRRIVPTIVQLPPKPPETDAKPSESNEPTGDGTGDGKGPPGVGVPEGTCTQEPCGEGPPRKEEPPKQVEEPPKRDVILDPRTLTLLRTHGTTQIHPNDSVKTLILRSGKPNTVAVVKVCMDGATGAIKQVSVLRSSGYPAYDEKLVSTIRADWRYKPYGAPVTACGTVTFQYQLQ